MLPRRRCPLWFEVVVAVALVLLLRELDTGYPSSGRPGDDGTPPAQALWPLVFLVASAIWKGLEVAGKVTLEILKWSVLQLWAFARTTYGALVGFGKEFIIGVRRAWDFLQATYDRVLRPAWDHFWKWFDRAKAWLEDVFQPVFRWLQFVRQYILDFYAKYVRPILDVLGIAQRVLRVFEALGIDWARRLDAQLAEIQRRIDAPFRIAIAKINEIVNLVNRVVTLDGLFQRVALIRSIERDIREVSRAFANWRSNPLTESDWSELRQRRAEVTIDDVIADARVALVSQGGRHAAVIAEIVADWKLSFGRRND